VRARGGVDQSRFQNVPGSTIHGIIAGNMGFYAISTVFNLAEKKKESVAGLRSFLLDQTVTGGDKAVLQVFSIHQPS